MVGGHHWLNGHEFEQALGDGKGQGSLACCSPWGHKESDMTERLNNRSVGKYRVLRSPVYGDLLRGPPCETASGSSWTTWMVSKPLSLITPAVRLWDVTVSRVWSFIPGIFQKTEIILRIFLWSTPVTRGTNHTGLVSMGTYSDLLPFGVEKATRFSKHNPLHILYITE